MLWGSFNGYKVALVQSLEDLAFIRSNLYANILVGCDSETTGLSFVSDYVVGICLSTGRTYSKADYVGYYIPLRHYGYSRNLPIKEVMEFVQFVVDNYMTAWWNRSFDFSMLEKDGFKAPFVGKTHDIQFMAHEVFNDRMPKLKDWAKRFLKFQTISYEENEAENNDFGSTDPEVSFIYAGGDPLITALLGLKIWSDYPNIRKIYSLDNECGEAVRRMTQQEIYLDYDFLDAELRMSNEKMESLRQQIYQLVGYSFNVDSGPQIAEALGRFVTLTVRTERGGLKVDKNVLATIDHPLAKLLLEYSEVSTYIKSFVSKMCSWRGTPVRINYNLTVALTGRMSSSGSKGNDYYKPLNGQNLPKIEVKAYLHTHPVLGYCLTDEADGAVCDASGNPIKYKTKAGMRSAFLPAPAGEDGWAVLGCDYSSEEIVCAGNMAREDGFLHPVKHGLDVHLYVAKERFGVTDPAFRSKSKAVSFGKLYGGGPSLIAQRLNISRQAAVQLISDYDKGMPRLKAWQDEVVRTAKRTGFSRTYFGRTIYLARWFSSPDNGMRAYAERVAKNSTIQGPAHKDTLVLTSLGYVPIKHLYTLDQRGDVSRHGIKCWNGVKWCDFHVVDAGLGDLLKFRFKRGNEVVVDVRHQFKVWTDAGTEFVDATSLSVGDNVAGSLCRLQEFPELYFCWSGITMPLPVSCRRGYLSSADSSKLLWWIGYALGDGNFTSQGIRYVLGSHEIYRYEEAKQFFNSIGIPVTKLSFYSKDMPGRRGDAYMFNVNSLRLRRLLMSMGLDFGWVHHTKRIPWRFCCSSIEQRKALVDGFFASDGCKTQEQFMWHMCQGDILRDLQRLLRTLGFDSVVRPVDSGRSWQLCVCSTNAFAEFMGYSTKALSGRMHSGRWFDRRLVPKALCRRFVDWFVSNNPSWLVADKTRIGSNLVLVRRMRDGGQISFTTFESICADCGYTDYQFWGDYLESQEIVSIESLPADQCYCLSLEDDSHCYDTDGLISHNCLPNTLYLSSQDGKSYRPWKDFAGQRVDFVDPLSGVRRMGVPTFRGEEELHVVIFNTGDFVVCNRGHKFVKYGTDDVVIDLDSCGRIPVRMGKPFKRPRLSWLRGLFSRGEFSLEQLAALAHMGRPIAVDDWGIYWGLLKSFLGSKRFHTRSFVTAATLRSVCDLFGWNLVYDFAASSSTDYVFKLCRGRKLKAHAVFAMPLGVTHNIMSPSMCSGLPVYPLCGFVHKNTGGDLIRRDLIRLMRYRDMDPEFAANTRFVVTVHDEIQIASRIPYLAKAVCVLQRIMNFWPSNFEVPLVTEPCVGLTWGYELDIHAVDKKTGKLWPKDFTPPQEYIDSGDWYFVDSWLEQEKAKRGVSW